jgi:hypothetical protein
MRKIGNVILNAVKNLKVFLLVIIIGTMTACDVHEWPETPEYVKFHLRLNYETDMTKWYHLYDGVEVIEQGYGETYDNRQEYGKIRYIVRAYPISEKMRTTSAYTQEFVFSKNIASSYNHEVTLDLPDGNYNIMVWSDLVQTNGETSFYNASNFAEIRLQGKHQANDDYRDAFRGSNHISLVSDIMERLPDTLDIVMQRPLAKYEFITNDVKEFIDREAPRLTSKSQGKTEESNEDAPSRAINIEDYKVVFYYVGFMPNAYSMNTDKPVDSSTGVFFESKLRKVTESEATIGFDYVFVNGSQSAVTVQIGIYDKEGTQLSLTEPIEVPLKRSHHTILTGMFLMSEASGGVSINPDFDGDHNLVFP